MDTDNKLEGDFKLILQETMKAYHNNFMEFLDSQPSGALMESDVILMIMNLSTGIATNVYYSLKQYVPSATIDFDFIKAKMINSLVDSFEGIKKHNPKEAFQLLSPEQVAEIEKNGFVIIKDSSGIDFKVTADDIKVTKKEADTIIKQSNSLLVKDKSAKKLIVAPEGTYQ